MKKEGCLVTLATIGVVLIIGTIVCDIFSLLPDSYWWVSWVVYILGGIAVSWALSAANKSSRNRSLAKLLILSAMTDGKIEDSEETLLLKAIGNLGLSKSDLNQIYKEIQEHNASFIVPEDDGEKKSQILAIAKMIVADGNVSVDEKRLFMEIGDKFGFSEDYLEKLLKEMKKQQY